MKVAIIGSGYVGLCTGVGLAKLGHEVITVDIDKAKVVDIKTNNKELKSYIIDRFNTISFENSSEKEGITYFVDINFKVL